MQPTNEPLHPSSPETNGQPSSSEKRLNDFFLELARGSEARSPREEAIQADYELLLARAEAERIVRSARLEACELLSKTIAAIDMNTALAEAARDEEEQSRAAERQARLEAERELSIAREIRANAEEQLARAQATSAEMMSAVEAECERQLEWARAASRAEFVASHRELAEGLLPICDAFVEVCGGLDRFITQAGRRPGSRKVSIDLRPPNASVAAGSGASQSDLDAPPSPAPVP